MIDWNRIRKYEENNKRFKEKLNNEEIYNKREIIKWKIKILEIKIKIEKLK
jgi:hypothetical protein